MLGGLSNLKALSSNPNTTPRTLPINSIQTPKNSSPSKTQLSPSLPNSSLLSSSRVASIIGFDSTYTAPPSSSQGSPGVVAKNLFVLEKSPNQELILAAQKAMNITPNLSPDVILTQARLFLSNSTAQLRKCEAELKGQTTNQGRLAYSQCLLDHSRDKVMYDNVVKRFSQVSKSISTSGPSQKLAISS